MYRSYEAHSFWPFLSAPTQGIHINFIRAQNSSYNWTRADLDRLAAYGHGVHTLVEAGRQLCIPIRILHNAESLHSSVKRSPDALCPTASPDPFWRAFHEHLGLQLWAT